MTIDWDASEPCMTIRYGHGSWHGHRMAGYGTCGDVYDGPTDALHANTTSVVEIFVIGSGTPLH